MITEAEKQMARRHACRATNYAAGSGGKTGEPCKSAASTKVLDRHGNGHWLYWLHGKVYEAGTSLENVLAGKRDFR